MENDNEEQEAAFTCELNNFNAQRNQPFRPLMFHGQQVNCFKLWTIVQDLNGYDQVSKLKLWGQVGNHFDPPKTRTNLAYTFRNFYEKALLEFERHKNCAGDHLEVYNQPEVKDEKSKRKASTLAREIWNNALNLNSDKNTDITLDYDVESHLLSKPRSRPQLQLSTNQPKLKSGMVETSLSGHNNEIWNNALELDCVENSKRMGVLKRKRYTGSKGESSSIQIERNNQSEFVIEDIGPKADWVKLHVQKIENMYEVHALVPGLVMEKQLKIQIQSQGRVIIAGNIDDSNDIWGRTSFKKVIIIPNRINPHKIDAIDDLHGKLFLRIPLLEE